MAGPESPLRFKRDTESKNRVVFVLQTLLDQHTFINLSTLIESNVKQTIADLAVRCD